MKIFLIIFLFFISTSVLGAENADSSTPRHNIHQTCETSYDLCLALIPQYLNETPIYSRLWYAYKLYQIEALSALERFDESEKELLPFISKKDFS